MADRARRQGYWPEYYLCENVVNMASNIYIREESLRSRREEEKWRLGLNRHIAYSKALTIPREFRISA